MIAVEPVSTKAASLNAPTTKSTNSATATACVLVAMGPLYHRPCEKLDGANRFSSVDARSADQTGIETPGRQGLQDLLRLFFTAQL